MSVLSPTREDHDVARRVTGEGTRDLPIRPVTELTDGDRFVARGRVHVVDGTPAHHPGDQTVSVPCHGIAWDPEYVEQRQVIVLPGSSDRWEATPTPGTFRTREDARRAARDAILVAHQAGVSTSELVHDVIAAVRSLSLIGMSTQADVVPQVVALIESDR